VFAFGVSGVLMVCRELLLKTLLVREPTRPGSPPHEGPQPPHHKGFICSPGFPRGPILVCRGSAPEGGVSDVRLAEELGERLDHCSREGLRDEDGKTWRSPGQWPILPNLPVH